MSSNSSFSCNFYRPEFTFSKTTDCFFLMYMRAVHTVGELYTKQNVSGAKTWLVKFILSFFIINSQAVADGGNLSIQIRGAFYAGA